MIDFVLLNRKENYFIDWKDVFQNDNPIYLEIGIGNGEFIIWLAKNNENANYIGIDVSKEIFRKAVGRVRKSGLKNIRLMRVEGTEFLCKYLSAESLNGVYINFPDPWFKKDHKERRLINEFSLYLISDRLKIGGFFIMVTDNEDYAHDVLNLFKKFDNFQPLWDSGIRNSYPEYYKTKYARKWLALGLPIFYLGFQKKASKEIPEWLKEYYPLLKITREDLHMPLLEIETPKEIYIGEILESLPKGVVLKEDLLLIKFVDFYYNNNSILIDVVNVEGFYRQRFFVSIAFKDKNRVNISVHESDDPDPVFALHKTLLIIGRLIKDRIPGSKVLQNTTKIKEL